MFNPKDNENPNYQPNAFSRFYEKIIAGAGKVWKHRNWVGRHYLILIFAYAIVLSIFWVPLIYTIWDNVATLTAALGEVEETEDRRNLAYPLGVSIAALAALAAAPLYLIRVWVNERNANTAEQGLITDRFTKAVEQLGAEKTVRRVETKPLYKKDANGEWLRDTEDNPMPATRPDGKPLIEYESIEKTEPNLEVRLGAIYALERITQDSERDHTSIMETLCAYIRENSHDHISTDEEMTRRPRVDIQAVLDVLSRRTAERIEHETAKGFMLDLTYADFRQRNLRDLRLQRVELAHANLEGADLRGARLEGANLHSANLKSADLRTGHVLARCSDRRILPTQNI